MSDGFKIQGKGTEDINILGRGHSEQLQTLARTALSSIYMLIRSVRLYDPDNAVFQRPLETLRDTLNAIVQSEGKLELQIVKDSFYVNEMLVKVDPNSMDNVLQIIREFEDKDIGGLGLSAPISLEELRGFVQAFAKGKAVPLGDAALPGHQLVSLRIKRWAKIKERLDKTRAEEGGPGFIDREKFAITVYARTALFVRGYLETMRVGRPIPSAPAGRLVQDLVDICFEQKTHFLGIASAKPERDYPVYHAVNSALLAIAFGVELGLSRAQLKDLGMAALLHDAGLARMPPGMLEKPRPLTPEDKKALATAPREAVKAILSEGELARPHLWRLAVSMDQMQELSAHTTVCSRIVAIVHVYDALVSKRPFRDAFSAEEAFRRMRTDFKDKLDQPLVEAFVATMQGGGEMHMGGVTVEIG